MERLAISFTQIWFYLNNSYPISIFFDVPVLVTSKLKIRKELTVANLIYLGIEIKYLWFFDNPNLK